MQYEKDLSFMYNIFKNKKWKFPLIRTKMPYSYIFLKFILNVFPLCVCAENKNVLVL